jgi:4-amino-4-deoxy-L-arabinose transferase-like glycosyltransferase
MKTSPTFPAALPRPLWRSILGRPRTRLGRWAAGLEISFLALFLINAFVFMPLTTDAPWQHMLLPFYGIAMLLVGLLAGILGLVAVLRRRERSWLVWLALLPGLFVIFLLFGEFLAPH